MAPKSSSAAGEIDRLQREMAQHRLALHQDVWGAVENAQSLIDWTAPIRTHPWISFALALAGGYFVVPKRKPADESRPVENGRSWLPFAPSTPPVEARPVRESSLGASLMGGLLGFVKPIAFNMARNYAYQELERYLSQNMFGPSRFTERESDEAAETRGDAPGRRRDLNR